MRLKDVEGLNQEDCANKMRISRQTFQLIIEEARKKTAVALREGKAINISGGNYISCHCDLCCFVNGKKNLERNGEDYEATDNNTD